MDDEVIGDLAKEDLLKVGFVTGKAVKFLKAFALTSKAPTAEAAAETNAPSEAKNSEAKAADDAKVAAKFRRVRNVLEQLQLLKLYNGLVAQACLLAFKSSLFLFTIRICRTH